ncbi:MAG: Cell shape-determining protein MreC [Acidobacteria bacterium]|nr:Cell shape-determining protein MreC [Acidobacteriota bacterium]
MALLDIRQRAGYLFIAVTVGHIVLISAQVNTDRGVPVLEAVTFGLFAEIQRGVSSVIGGVRTSWGDYLALQTVRGENERLRQEVARMQIALQEERALAQQSRTLEQLLDLRSQSTLATVAAGVIAGSASPDFRTLTINKGTADGLRPDMAVMAPAGIVGRIITPSGRAAKVQLLIDRNAAAGALVERSRAQGVVEGTGGYLRLNYVSSTADVTVGDVVVTSGIDGIYPKGVVIGQIESVERGGGAFGAIVIRPAVDFSSLEGVLVVLTPPAAADGEPAAGSGTQARE